MLSIVCKDLEYAEVLRGRAAYNTKTNSFNFLGDRCILKDKDMVASIRRQHDCLLA